MPRQFEGNRLVVASHNPGKVREIADLLAPFGVTPVSAGDFGLPEPVEDGDTFVANAILSTAFARRGFGPRNAFIQFLVTGLLNAGILVAILIGLQLGGEELDFRRLGFMLLLVTLLVTLYDRYRPEYVGRISPEGRAA